MSFIAECVFCNTKVKVPDGAAGLSVPCPKCGNSFTLATLARESRSSLGIKLKTPKKEAPLAGMNGPATPAVLSPKAKFVKNDAPVPEEYVKQALGAEQLQKALAPTEKADAETPGPGRIANPVGACSFLLGSLGLLFAQIAPLSFLAIPLGIVGLALGAGAMLLGLNLPGRYWILPAGGTVVSLTVMGIVFFCPELFGLPSALAGADENEGGQQSVVSVEKDKTQRRASGMGEWVDASKESLQNGSVRLRVTSAQIKLLTIKDPSGQPGPARKSLVIGLRLININGAGKIGYRSWQGSGEDSSRLEDDNGKTNPAVRLESGQEIVGHVNGADLFPGQPVGDVLAYRAPPVGFKYLRLELPAAAFGGSGTLRLQIPAAMIVER